MRIAVIGSGISGMLAAYLLHNDHDVTVYEADERIGGHTHTVDVDVAGETYRVDTGFIVYNQGNYPNFSKLLRKLDVPTQASDMSFSVSIEQTGLEYGLTALDQLFAQRHNIVQPQFWSLVTEIVRFTQDAKRFLRRGDEATTLQGYVRSRGFSRLFLDGYLMPLASAIWSARPDMVYAFPAAHFFRFFQNHGLLNLWGQPVWRTIVGGSSRYAEALTAGYRDRIRLKAPVEGMRREPERVHVKQAGQDWESYDQAVVAVHSDQALRILTDPTPDECDVLGAIQYEDNDVVLHTDDSLLPKTKRAWASWNYYVASAGTQVARLTYNMNRLQRLTAPVTFCVSVNDTARIRPETILRRFTYAHPVFSQAAIAAQKRHGEISGQNRTHYCGAYWGYGFHEDGVASALAAVAPLGVRL